MSCVGSGLGGAGMVGVRAGLGGAETNGAKMVGARMFGAGPATS